MDRTIPSATRRWAGALSLPLFFLALIGATVSDPVEDETATRPSSCARRRRTSAGCRRPSCSSCWPRCCSSPRRWRSSGRLRGRGSGLANAGAVLGILGGVGLTMIAVGHVFLYALAASGTSDGVARSSRPGTRRPARCRCCSSPHRSPIAVLCGAAVRGGLVRWPLLVVAGAFLVLEYVPSPLGEVPSLVAGLVAYAWIAVALVGTRRRRPRAGRGTPRADRLTGGDVPDRSLASRP